MTAQNLIERLRSLLTEELPLPGHETPLRHRRLMEVGCKDLSLARLAEAHWDAVAILAEAGRAPSPGAIYGVWASERPGQALQLQEDASATAVSGSKTFCSGAGCIDRALVTVGALLIDICDKTQQLKFMVARCPVGQLATINFRFTPMR